MYKKTETQQNRGNNNYRGTICVVGKKGSYSIPTKLLQKQPIQQHLLYKEFWNCSI